MYTTCEYRVRHGLIHFDGGSDSLFPNGRDIYLDAWLPILEIARGSITFRFELAQNWLPTGGPYWTYAYAGSKRTPGIEEDD